MEASEKVAGKDVVEKCEGDSIEMRASVVAVAQGVTEQKFMQALDRSKAQAN